MALCGVEWPCFSLQVAMTTTGHPLPLPMISSNEIVYIPQTNTNTVLHLTILWFKFLGQLMSAHQEGIPATVGFMDLSDLHRVVHQVILDGNRPGLPVQRVSVVPQGKEMQHLNKKRLGACN